MMGRYGLLTAYQKLTEMCFEKARALYGDPLPTIVESRITKELKAINDLTFASDYLIAAILVDKSDALGYG